MSNLTMFSTKIDKDLKDKMKQLSTETRIPQAKLVAEAFEDLFKKYIQSISKL